MHNFIDLLQVLHSYLLEIHQNTNKKNRKVKPKETTILSLAKTEWNLQFHQADESNNNVSYFSSQQI